MTAEERFAVRQLLELCEKLRHEMGGTPASRDCAGLVTKWDSDYPTFCHLERAMANVRGLLE